MCSCFAARPSGTTVAAVFLVIRVLLFFCVSVPLRSSDFFFRCEGARATAPADLLPYFVPGSSPNSERHSCADALTTSHGRVVRIMWDAAAAPPPPPSTASMHPSLQPPN